MHQVFSVLTHCSAFKSCCLLQWDTGKALLLNFYSLGFDLFFFSFLIHYYQYLLPDSRAVLTNWQFLTVASEVRFISATLSHTHAQCFCFRTPSMSRVHGQVFVLFGQKSTEPFFVWCVLVCWSSTTVGYILLLSDCERMPPSKELNMEIKADLY